MDNLRVGKPPTAELSKPGPGHPVSPLRPASQNFQPDFLFKILILRIGLRGNKP